MRTHLLIALVLAGLLGVACGRAPEAALPTPIVALTPSPDEQPATATPTEAVAVPVTPTQPQPPTLAPVTTTAVPGPTAEPTATAAPTGVPTTAPTSAATPLAATPAMTPPVPVGDGSYQVAFVEGNDTLNVRSGPGTTYEAVAELPPIAAGVAVEEGGQAAVAGSTWVYVTTDAAEGWVNGRFLTESVPAAEFCADPAALAVVERAREAIAAQDGRALALLVHPERGLRLRLNWWNNEILVRGEEVAGLFDSAAGYDWGVSQGSGEPIVGTFAEAFLPPLQRDLLPASQTACDELLFGPTAGMVVLPDGYQQVHFFSLHRPAPADVEFDWGTWAVGVERWQGDYYLSYLVHYDYEI